MRNEYAEMINRCSAVAQTPEETISQHSSCDPLSISDSTEDPARQQQQSGITIISSLQDTENLVTDRPSPFDTLSRSLTTMSFRASDVSSCSLSTLIANISHYNIIESDDGDLIIIDKKLSKFGRHNDKDEEDCHDLSYDDYFSTEQLERVGSRMLIEEVQSISEITNDSEDDSSTKDAMQDYYFSLLSSVEVDAFSDTAKEILPHLIDFYESECTASLPMPPLPPTHILDEVLDVSCSTESLISILPSEFICPLCQLPIVGAMILSCIHQNQILCTLCVEQHCFLGNSSKCNKGAHSKREDYSVFCPICKEQSNHTPCHALDVAILKFMMDFDHFAKRWQDAHSLCFDSKSLKAFQAKFYQRVLAWHVEVRDRNDLKDYNKQLLLLEYAQVEKEEMMKYKEKTMQNHKEEMMKYKEKTGQNHWIHVATLVVSGVLFMGVRTLWRLR